MFLVLVVLLSLVPNLFANSTPNQGSIQNRIVHGWDSRMYHFYANIKIETPHVFFTCGATLIHPRILATAAHCFADFLDAKITAKFLGSDVVYNVGDRVIADSFSKITGVDDIALLMLEKEVENGRTLPLCEAENFGNKILSIIGFGDIGYNGTYENGVVIGVEPDRLQEAYMAEVDCQVVRDKNAEFQGALADFVANDSKQVCLQGKHNESACDGDSGGPLFPLDRYGNPVCLYGVMNYMPGGSTPDNWACSYGLSVYTRVPAYLDWISKNVQRMLKITN